MEEIKTSTFTSSDLNSSPRATLTAGDVNATTTLSVSFM